MELSEKGRLVRALGERGLKSLLSGVSKGAFLCVARNGAHRYGRVHTQVRGFLPFAHEIRWDRAFRVLILWIGRRFLLSWRRSPLSPTLRWELSLRESLSVV